MPGTVSLDSVGLDSAGLVPSGVGVVVTAEVPPVVTGAGLIGVAGGLGSPSGVLPQPITNTVVRARRPRRGRVMSLL